MKPVSRRCLQRGAFRESCGIGFGAAVYRVNADPRPSSSAPAPNPKPKEIPTMRYMIMFRNDGDSEVDVPPCLDLDEMGNFIGELQSTGVLLGYEGLKPSEKGARVRLTGGKR